jgi:hypothetical protein
VLSDSFLRDARGIHEPAQHQQRLAKRTEHAGAATGTQLGTAPVQQSGQEVHGVAGRVQGGGERDGAVCDAGHAKLLAREV